MFETTCRVCSLKAHIGFGRVHPWIFHASRNAAPLLWLGLGSQFPEPLHKLLSLSLRLEIRYVHLHCLNVVNKVHVQASYVIPFPSSHRFRMLSTWLCSCRWCFCIADAASDVGCQLCPFSDWVAHEQMSLLWILEPQWSGEVESLLECCYAWCYEIGSLGSDAQFQFHRSRQPGNWSSLEVFRDLSKCINDVEFIRCVQVYVMAKFCFALSHVLNPNKLSKQSCSGLCVFCPLCETKTRAFLIQQGAVNLCLRIKHAIIEPVCDSFRFFGRGHDFLKFMSHKVIWQKFEPNINSQFHATAHNRLHSSKHCEGKMFLI